MDQILPILSLLFSLAIGVIAGWLVLRAKGQNAYDRGKMELPPVEVTPRFLQAPEVVSGDVCIRSVPRTFPIDLSCPRL